MVDEQGHQQLGAAEAAALIHGCDAIPVAVKHDAHGRPPRGGARLDRADQLAQVGSQGLGRVAAKQGVAPGPDLADGAAVCGPFPQQGRQHPGCGAVHRVHDHRQPQPIQPLGQGGGVDLGLEPGHVGAHGIKLANLARYGHGQSAGGQSGFNTAGEVALHRAAERALDFQPQPFRWVVAGRDHQSSQGLALHYGPARGGGGGGGVAEQGGKAAAPHCAADRLGQLGGQEAAVIADDHLPAGEACRGRMGQFLGRGRRDWQQALHGDVDAQDAAPAIGAEGDRTCCQGQGG